MMGMGMKRALMYKDVPGAGAAARRKYAGNPQNKVGIVMKEFKRGTLYSGSGRKVRNRRQAVAIAMSESGLSKKRKRYRPTGHGRH